MYLKAASVCLLLAASAVASDAPKAPARWDHLEAASTWNHAAEKALTSFGAGLVEVIPKDIGTYCPAYPGLDREGRQSFWIALLSSLSMHESTWRAGAVGGQGRWFGLLQISPGTARAYGCAARSGAALKDGAANVSCTIRIWSQTVLRDGVISQGMRGVAADWGPFHSGTKRRDIIRWTSRQPYCQSSPRPVARPE